MGFSLKKIVQHVAAPVVTAPIQVLSSAKNIAPVNAILAPVTVPLNTAASIAKGENVVQSVVTGAAGFMAATQPMTMLNTATSGAVASATGKIPLVGGFLSKNISLGSSLSTGGGDMGDATQYAAGQAAIAGAVAAGVSASGFIGSTSAATGAAAGAGGELSAASLIPIAASAFKTTSGSGREPAGDFTAAQRPQGGSSIGLYLVLGGAALATVFILRKGKR